MPCVDWSIHGTSSPGGIPADDSDPHLMLLTTKKRLTRPYSSSHIQASLRRLGRDAVNQRSRTAVRRATTAAVINDEGRDGKICTGNFRAASAGLLRVSPMTTRGRSAECKSASDIDDELEIDYRKIENEDPDRMTESEVYQGQGVRKLNTQNYEHEYLRGGLSPSIVQASKRLQAGKHAGVTVVRIGSKYHDGLKITGVPIEAKMIARSKDDDALYECSVSSGDICLCHNCRNKESGEDPLAQEINGKLQNVTNDKSTLLLVSKSLGITAPIKRPCSNTQDNRKNYNKDRVKAQEHKENNNRVPLSRCSSAKCQVFSPPTVKIDSTNLPVMACRAITGPRMRYEVVSSLGRKDIEDDRDSASSGSDTDLNKQIEAVARAQSVIDHHPNADERTPKQSEVQIFSWRPALKDILRSQSVSLRRRSIDCIYVDSTSQAKCLKHGRQCPEIPRTVQDDSVGGYPSSQVWSRGRRLKISIDMRSLRLPPIMSYSTRSVENNSAGCVACMAGVSNSC